MPFPLKNREGIMYGFGADRMNTHGSILVMAKSVKLINDPELLEEVKQ
jgi:hypothetical protein